MDGRWRSKNRGGKKFSSSSNHQRAQTLREYTSIYWFKSTTFHSVIQFSHKHQWLEVWIKWICVLVWLKGEANTFSAVLFCRPLTPVQSESHFLSFVCCVNHSTDFLVIGLAKLLVDHMPRLPVGCPHVYLQACKMVGLSPYTTKHTHLLTNKFGYWCSLSKVWETIGYREV